MYTQCPECLTIFKLADADPAVARGSVRCGHCAAVFDALRTLATQLPPEPIGMLGVHATQLEPPRLDLPVFRPNPAQTTLFEQSAAHPVAHESTSTPTFATTRRHPRRHARNWPWLLGNALLLLTLGAQIAWSERTHWIDNARVREWLDPACAKLGCHLPLRHDPARLELLSRDIQPHPSVPGALIISATLRNDAAFAQPYPTVEIVLSDLDEKRIAMRRFAPRDYVGDSRAIAAGLAAGASTSLVFEVADPGRNAVAFQFDFE